MKTEMDANLVMFTCGYMQRDMASISLFMSKLISQHYLPIYMHYCTDDERESSPEIALSDVGVRTRISRSRSPNTPTTVKVMTLPTRRPSTR